VGGYSETLLNRSWGEENWIPLENGHYQLKDDRTDEEKKYDHQQLFKAIDLQNAEWTELWEIISKGKNHEFDARGWWD
jgi:hypothetical protein